MPLNEWSEDSVTRILMNPLYCLVETAGVSEDQWIKATAKMMREMGEESYLATLLAVTTRSARVRGRQDVTPNLRENSRAQIATIPAFSPHICARELVEITPLPVIDFLDAIVAEVDCRKIQRLSINPQVLHMTKDLSKKIQVCTEARNALQRCRDRTYCVAEDFNQEHAI